MAVVYNIFRVLRHRHYNIMQRVPIITLPYYNIYNFYYHRTTNESTQSTHEVQCQNVKIIIQISKHMTCDFNNSMLTRL